MSETQLERSVLEAKEREELFAIADALGTTPTARATRAEDASSACSNSRRYSGSGWYSTGSDSA